MYSNGIISAPINASDPYYVMGVGQHDGWWDSITQCNSCDLDSHFDTSKSIVIQGDVIVDSLHSPELLVVVTGVIAVKGAYHGV